MKALLVYYTGTYNTRYLTQKIKRRLEGNGDEVDTVEINRSTPVVDTSGYDVIGFSYPIYGFNSPLPFNKYVRALRFNEGQKYFIYKQSGETFAINNASSRILMRIMKKKKADFVGEYHFVMPYNIHFAFDRAFIREIFQKNEKLADIMLYELSHGIVNRIKSSLWYNLGAFFVGIQKLGGPVNSFFYRVDMDKCVKCNKCVRDCPENNIFIKKDKIKFGRRCDMCMRCSFFCPTNAIKIGFLEGWKVNGAYDYDEIEQDTSPVKSYITQESKGFYSCFIKYFEGIDKRHQEIFGK